MVVKADNVEIRGTEDKISQKDNKPYSIVYFEDNHGSPNQILCRDVNLAKKFKKGTIVNMLCELKLGKFTQFDLIDMTPVQA